MNCTFSLQVTHRVSGREKAQRPLVTATSHSDVGQQALAKDLVTVVLTVYLRACFYGFVKYMGKINKDDQALIIIIIYCHSLDGATLFCKVDSN